MKEIISLVFVVFIIDVAFSQRSSVDLKWKDGKLEGFYIIDSAKIPGLVQKSLMKLKKKYKYAGYYEEDTLKYYRNNDGYFGIRFVSTYYELTFVAVNNEGKWIQATICSNPEFKDYYTLDEKLTEMEYLLLNVESPESAVHKYISPSGSWFEVSANKDYNDSIPATLIFDSKYQFLPSGYR